MAIVFQFLPIFRFFDEADLVTYFSGRHLRYRLAAMSCVEVKEKVGGEETFTRDLSRLRALGKRQRSSMTTFRPSWTVALGDLTLNGALDEGIDYELRAFVRRSIYG